jgi:hypothetical protein
MVRKIEINNGLSVIAYCENFATTNKSFISTVGITNKSMMIA